MTDRETLRYLAWSSLWLALVLIVVLIAKLDGLAAVLLLFSLLALAGTRR